MPILPKLFPRNDQQKQADYERALIRMESEIGGQLFGPVPKGHSRRFFCLDEHTWVWHEEWQENGRQRVVTTRYDVRPNGVVKIQDGQPTRMITKAEADNLARAVRLYQQKVDAAYVHMIQTQ
jgi:hypothetical protein